MIYAAAGMVGLSLGAAVLVSIATWPTGAHASAKPSLATLPVTPDATLVSHEQPQTVELEPVPAKRTGQTHQRDLDEPALRPPPLPQMPPRKKRPETSAVRTPPIHQPGVTSQSSDGVVVVIESKPEPTNSFFGIEITDE